MGLGWLVFTAVGGFTAYGFLAKRVSTSLSTTFAYVNPVVAVGLGSLLFGEPLSMRMMAATLVVVLGVFLIVSASGQAPQRRVHHHPMTSGHGHVVRLRDGEVIPHPVGPQHTDQRVRLPTAAEEVAESSVD
jgi:hypothetical protein